MPSNTANKKRKNKKEPQDKAEDKSAELNEDSKKDDTAFDMEEAVKTFEEKYKEITSLSGYSQYPSTGATSKRTGPTEWKRVSDMLTKALEKRNGKK